MKITDKHGQQWQLVPVEPTESIERAYCWQQEKSGFLNCYPIYRAMLTAAPEPELSDELETVAYVDFPHCLMRTAKGIDMENGSQLILRSQAEMLLAKKNAEIERLNREASVCDMLEEYRQDAQTTADALGSIQRQFEMVNQDRDYWIACHAKIFRKRNELREQVQRQAALLEQCRVALQYASAETKPDGLSGCDCPLCHALAAIEKELLHD